MTNPDIQDPAVAPVAPASVMPQLDPAHVSATPSLPASAAPTLLAAIACSLVAVAPFVGLIPTLEWLSFGERGPVDYALYVGASATTVTTCFGVGQALIRSVWLSALSILAAVIAIAALLLGLQSQMFADAIHPAVPVLAVAFLALVASGLGLVGSLRSRSARKPRVLTWIALAIAVIAFIARDATDVAQRFSSITDPFQAATVGFQLAASGVALWYFLTVGIRHPAARGVALGFIVLLAIVHVMSVAFSVLVDLDNFDPLDQLAVVALGLRLALYLAAIVCLALSFRGLARWRRLLKSELGIHPQ